MSGDGSLLLQVDGSVPDLGLLVLNPDGLLPGEEFGLVLGLDGGLSSSVLSNQLLMVRSPLLDVGLLLSDELSSSLGSDVLPGLSEFDLGDLVFSSVGDLLDLPHSVEVLLGHLVLDVVLLSGEEPLLSEESDLLLVVISEESDSQSESPS